MTRMRHEKSRGGQPGMIRRVEYCSVAWRHGVHALACVLLSLALLLNATTAHADNGAPPQRLNLLELADFIPDPDREITPETAFNRSGWQQVAGRLPVPGHERFWLRASLESLNTPGERLLVVSNARLQAVTVYWSADGEDFRQVTVNDRTPVNQRPVPHRKLIYPVEPRNAGELLILLEVQGGNLAQPAVELWEPDAFWVADTRDLLLLGLFLGLLFTVAAYNLIPFALLREPSHLFYSLFLLSGAFAMLAWTGLGYQFLWPAASWFHHRSVDLFLLLGLACACLFVVRLFSLDTRTPGQYVLLNALAGLALLGMLASPLLSQTELTRATVGLALLVAITTFTVGILHWRAGVGAARYFSLANGLALIGALAMLFPHWVLARVPLRPDEALMLGAVGGIALWSLALVHRITAERQSRRRAEREALQNERLLREAREQALLHEPRGS